MNLVIVRVRVKPECVEDFKAASAENARNSILEPGCARFDVIQQADDPTRFMFLEAFRTPDAHATHSATPHYITWRDTVTDMMAEPRQAVKHVGVFPLDQNW